MVRLVNSYEVQFRRRELVNIFSSQPDDDHLKSMGLRHVRHHRRNRLPPARLQ